MKKAFSVMLILALLVTTFAPATVFAEEEIALSMANVYADNMVLQANEEVVITGYATSGTSVTADIDMAISSTNLDVTGATSISAMLLEDMANIRPLCAAATK